MSQSWVQQLCPITLNYENYYTIGISQISYDCNDLKLHLYISKYNLTNYKLIKVSLITYGCSLSGEEPTFYPQTDPPFANQFTKSTHRPPLQRLFCRVYVFHFSFRLKKKKVIQILAIHLLNLHKGWP